MEKLGPDPSSLTKSALRALHVNGAGDKLFHVSRYENEYEELEFLAKGGFGKVYKVRNKLDGIEYAVKKLVIKYANTEVISKIIREVTTLAKLNHPHILCYKTAWLEPYVQQAEVNKTTSDQSWSPSETPTNLDDGDEQSSDTNSGTEADAQYQEDSSLSSGIVFTNETATSTSVKVAARSNSIQITNKVKNVFSIVEIDDKDINDNDDLVVGMAATPPDRSFQGSKFWLGADESDSNNDDPEVGGYKADDDVDPLTMTMTLTFDRPN